MAYVSALDPVGCPAESEQAITLKTTISDIDRGAAALDASLDRGDRLSGRCWCLACAPCWAGSNERYAEGGARQGIGPNCRRPAGRWRDYGPTAGAISPARHKPLAAWRDDVDRLAAQDLTPLESKSLFNPAVVARVVGVKAEKTANRR